MNFLDLLKRYFLSVLSLGVVIGVLLVLVQLYFQIYAPLFINPIISTSPGRYHIPDNAIEQALQQVEIKAETTVDFSSVQGYLSRPQLPSAKTEEGAIAEGITVEGAAP